MHPEVKNEIQYFGRAKFFRWTTIPVLITILDSFFFYNGSNEIYIRGSLSSGRFDVGKMYNIYQSLLLPSVIHESLQCSILVRKVILVKMFRTFFLYSHGLHCVTVRWSWQNDCHYSSSSKNTACKSLLPRVPLIFMLRPTAVSLPNEKDEIFCHFPFATSFPKKR